MNRKETEAALDKLKIEQSPTSYKTSHREFCDIYQIALYETALKYGVDPESEDVMFYFDIENGKGTKFDE